MMLSPLTDEPPRPLNREIRDLFIIRSQKVAAEILIAKRKVTRLGRKKKKKIPDLLYICGM
jgi:hypothetical protein